MLTFYTSWELDQKSHGDGIFCSYLKSFVQNLLKRERLKMSPLITVTETAVCRKLTKESTVKAKTVPTKPAKHAALALSLFVINALKIKKTVIRSQ